MRSSLNLNRIGLHSVLLIFILVRPSGQAINWNYFVRISDERTEMTFN